MIDSGPAAFVASDDPSFSFSSDSAVLRFECSLDGEAFSECTSAMSYSDVGEGPHTFRVRAEDLAGNVDPTPATHSFTVDNVGPQPQVTGPGLADEGPHADPARHRRAAGGRHPGRDRRAVRGGERQRVAGPDAQRDRGRAGQLGGPGVAGARARPVHGPRPPGRPGRKPRPADPHVHGGGRRRGARRGPARPGTWLDHERQHAARRGGRGHVGRRRADRGREALPRLARRRPPRPQPRAPGGRRERCIRRRHPAPRRRPVDRGGGPARLRRQRGQQRSGRLHGRVGAGARRRAPRA